MISERNSTNSTSSTTVLPQAKSGNAMQSSFDPSSNHSTNNNNNNNNNIASSAAERRLSANAKSNNILAAAAAATTAAGGAKSDSNLTEKLMLKSNQPNKGKADSAAADSVATEVVVANGGSAALLVVSSSSAELGAKSCSKANEQKEGQLFYDGNRVEQHPALVEKKKENYSLNGSRAANHIETHLWAASASASARASFEEDLNTKKTFFCLFLHTHTLNRWAAHIYRQKKEEEEEEIKNKRWCLKMISRWKKECLHLMHLSKNNGKRKKKFYSREKWKNYSKKSSCMQKEWANCTCNSI